MSLTGQRILVTGAAGGIGRAVVAALKEQGATVVASDISPPTDTGADVEIACDVTSTESCAAAFERAQESVGSLTGLSYISGVIHEASPIVDFDLDVWDHTFEVNVKGFLRLSQMIIPGLDSDSNAGLVAIASWWGHSGHAFFSAYCASKSAVKITVQSMADELARKGIRVNAVAPGNIDTSMHRGALESEAAERGLTFEELKEIEWDKIPMGYAGPTSSIADAVAFLHGPRSAYITGTTIDVNGGVMYR